MTPQERFWSFVRKKSWDGCWLWLGCANENGEGRFRDSPRRCATYAARYSWQIHFGRIPRRLSVCHHCDNPSCVNPKHLFLGTQAENMSDCHRKERNARGSRIHLSKFVESDIPIIRRIYQNGLSASQIAERYGVTDQTIYAIVHRKTWRHVA